MSVLIVPLHWVTLWCNENCLVQFVAHYLVPFLIPDTKCVNLHSDFPVR